MVKQLTLVALGGGAGSALRYLTSLYFMRSFSCNFPLGTFVVNIAGSFIIGLLVGLSVCCGILNNELRFLLIIGFCGGYTTFSTFSVESLRLFEAGNYYILALYISASIIAGLLAVLGGNALARIIAQ
ncbi:MAG: fluoride efflux transporter CrcB [Bacteroidales bacterium]